MEESPPLHPRVSIIIATYNAVKTLDRCLDSIFGQDFSDWEILIADGGSTDGTVELLRDHQHRLAYWHSHRDHGIYDAWNQALAEAKGEYVCFMGADDAWLDDRSLSSLLASQSADGQDLISSQGLVWTAGSSRRTRFGSAWNFNRLGRRMVVCHPGLMHRRALFDQHGPFDARFRIAGDLEFLLRLPKDIRTLHVPRDTILIEGEGISRRNTLARLREQRQILANCERYGPFRAYLAWLDKLWRLPIARALNIPH